MAEVPAQQPEGRLIGEALKRSKLSARSAAISAGISDTRWRHIVSGYQPAGQGHYIPVIGPPETLARMADVVGVTPEQLAEVGREDAADDLRILRQQSADHRPVGTGADPLDLSSLTPDEIEAVKTIIRAMRSGRQD